MPEEMLIADIRMYDCVKGNPDSEADSLSDSVK
jgi:hypothetical protein